MKKIFFLLFFVSSFTLLNNSCKEDDPETGSVLFEVYTKLCPDDNPSLVNSVAYLYPANNDENYVLETFDYNPSDILGDSQDYPAKDGSAVLSDGSRKHYVYSSNEGVFSRVKPGRYLLVVFINPESDEQYFAFQNKYSAKYIDVKEDQVQANYKKTIGGDVEKKGFQDWNLMDWKCYAN
jgi:hypothetical protein